MTQGDDERIEKAMALITRYGMIEGAHHKQWVLDQVARELLGEDYAAWVFAMNEDPEYEEWDTGIAP